MDPGRDPTAGLFSGLIVVDRLLKSGSLSDPVPFDTVVQLRDAVRDRDAVGLSCESPLKLHIIPLGSRERTTCILQYPSTYIR